MPPTPALSPDQALHAVLQTSRLNGWSVAVFAGLCTLATLPLGDLVGTFVGLVAVTSGMMEVRGNRRLRRRDAGGMKWLVRAQLMLLGVILAYAVSRLASFDAGYLKEEVIPEARQNLLLFGINLDDLLREGGMTLDDLVGFARLACWAFYGAVILATCLYQGGLALYYRRRTPLVAHALAAPPSLPIPPPIAPIS
ncbi:MAG: hypothetical protein PHQ04_05710 [Opitutaceae bacterium]|nr:hypothetical protein [Opitutaceae bacterium]